MVPLTKILFLDIETVPLTENFNELSLRMKEQWNRKASIIKNEEEKTESELFEDRGGIYAEFGRIVAISMGFFTLSEGGVHKFRIKSLYNKDEKLLIRDFLGYLNKFEQQNIYLCAHNGKEFDFPYLSRRILINGLKLPKILNNGGKKPWEVNFLDTMELWKFGDWKSYTSLDLMAAVFDIETSKGDIDGSMVAETFYKEDNLDKISEYCSRDVLVTARVYQRLQGDSPVADDDVIFT